MTALEERLDEAGSDPPLPDGEDSSDRTQAETARLGRGRQG